MLNVFIDFLVAVCIPCAVHRVGHPLSCNEKQQSIKSLTIAQASQLSWVFNNLSLIRKWIYEFKEQEFSLNCVSLLTFIFSYFSYFLCNSSEAGMSE